MSNAREPRTTARVKVLLLDDDDLNRELSRQIFQLHDVAVVCARTVADAERELIAAPEIDVISVDVSLRGLGHDKDGAVLAQRLRAIRPDLPIIGYSSYFDENALSSPERGAFTAYFSRGGSSKDIDEYVARCLDEGARYRSRRREVWSREIAELARTDHPEDAHGLARRRFGPLFDNTAKVVGLLAGVVAIAVGVLKFIG